MIVHPWLFVVAVWLLTGRSSLWNIRQQIRPPRNRNEERAYRLLGCLLSYGGLVCVAQGFGLLW